MALVLLLAFAGCAGDAAAPVPLMADAEPPPSAHPAATMRKSEAGAPIPEVRPPSPTPAPTPHVGVVTVVDVVQVASADRGQHAIAMLLTGDVGSSAILRTLEIQAWVEPVAGSGCGTPPTPTVLHPSHADAVRPVLADVTRQVVVRSLGDARPEGGEAILARFGSGPVPSLNGTFSGWVTFHFAADTASAFCAFDVSGAVIIVAGETTTAELPVLRVDSRTRLDAH